MSEPIIVTVADVRACNLCVRGARQWFSLHGLDFSTFLIHGYPIETIEATNDALGTKVATYARARAAGEEA